MVLFAKEFCENAPMFVTIPGDVAKRVNNALFLFLTKRTSLSLPRCLPAVGEFAKVGPHCYRWFRAINKGHDGH